MFESAAVWLVDNGKGVVVSLYIIVLYWIKEIMEYILRVVYGVDRRMMYVPIAQNVHAQLPFVGSAQLYQRAELFYYVFHSIISICLAILGFIAAVAVLD